MFELTHVSPRVGSEVRIDRASLLNGTHAKALENLLVERSALVFRELFLSDQDLPETERKALEGIKVRHALEATQRMVNPQPTLAELRRWRTRPSQSHPLVWHHRTGATSLVLGATSHYVEGMSPEDGAMLLCRLQDYATQDQYVYRHQWKVGDFLLWDNTGTMHRADSCPLDGKRLMHRTTLHGEEPLS